MVNDMNKYAEIDKRMAYLQDKLEVVKNNPVEGIRYVSQYYEYTLKSGRKQRECSRSLTNSLSCPCHTAIHAPSREGA